MRQESTMKPQKVTRVLLFLFALLLTAGCASTKVVKHEQPLTGPLPRPNHIWVYDFITTSAEVPRESGFANPRFRATQPPSTQDLEAGQRAASELAATLVEQLRDLGLPAQEASSSTVPEMNDVVIRGYFLSIDRGSTTARVVIGFGVGASQLTTAVEGFQVTHSGLRRLNTDTLESTSNKTPGEALGVVGLLATSNPTGLILGSGAKAAGEVTGMTKIEGRARATAREIANQLRMRFMDLGWFDEHYGSRLSDLDF